MPWDGFAVYPLGFFGEEFNERRTISNFTFCLGQGLALFSGEDSGQVIRVFHHEIKPPTQDNAALFSCERSPLFLCFFSARNRLRCLSAAEIRDLCNDIPTRGVRDVKRRTGLTIDPVTSKVALGDKEAWVFE